MSINLVWFKRDLRLSDHEPLSRAIADSIRSGRKILLLYIFEDLQLSDSHYSTRHWRFVYQSLMDMQQALPDQSLWIKRGNALDIFDELNHNLDINSIFSHQEIGLGNTYHRDIQLQNWCNYHQINWYESKTGAVIRGLSNRKTWDKTWSAMMRAKIEPTLITQAKFVLHKDKFTRLESAWLTQDTLMQQGGETQAQKVLHSFFELRGKSYAYSLSSPQLSQTHCSRLSAYLSWGNISLRQVYQATLQHWDQVGWRRSLVAFSSRLHWHCHFIQKFESEHTMEYQHLNRGYDNLPTDTSANAALNLNAWKNGQTGYPLIDACMLCLKNTGYINFRMRAMLVSFLTHNLALDWRLGVKHLASVFLDFEPGIHYSQFQMQAGVMGINTIRVYNPIKQSKEKDSEAYFITTWIPALKKLPLPLIHEPWLMTDMEQIMYGFTLGEDYPKPIVDIVKSGKTARDLLWQWKKRDLVQKEGYRIIARHVRKN